MSLAAFAVRRAVGALIVLLLVIALLQFAFHIWLPPIVFRGPADLPAPDFMSLFERDHQMWTAFPRDVLLAAAAIGLAVLAWRLAGALRERAARAHEVR